VPGPLADTVAVCRWRIPGPTALGRDVPGALAPQPAAAAGPDGGKTSRAASR